MKRRPNWISRALLAVPVIWPKLDDSIAEDGFEKFVVFSALKISVRNSAFTFSFTRVIFATAISTFACPGPRKIFLPVFPKRFPAGMKADLSKYRVRRSFVVPERVAVPVVAPGAQLA